MGWNSETFKRIINHDGEELFAQVIPIEVVERIMQIVLRSIFSRFFIHRSFVCRVTTCLLEPILSLALNSLVKQAR